MGHNPRKPISSGGCCDLLTSANASAGMWHCVQWSALLCSFQADHPASQPARALSAGRAPPQRQAGPLRHTSDVAGCVAMTTVKHSPAIGCADRGPVQGHMPSPPPGPVHGQCQCTATIDRHTNRKAVPIGTLGSDIQGHPSLREGYEMMT